MYCTGAIKRCKVLKPIVFTERKTFINHTLTRFYNHTPGNAILRRCHYRLERCNTCFSQELYFRYPILKCSSLNRHLGRNPLHTSAFFCKDIKKDLLKDLDEKSKVEEFVEHQQKKMDRNAQLEKQFKDAFVYKVDHSLKPNNGKPVDNLPSNETVVVKPSVMERVKHEMKHYYNGFRLLYLDIKIAARLLWQVLNGKTLTRRERKQFLRTVADLFRLVPFMVLIIIPFMEFLLPVVIKLFPGMLPSTFEDTKTKESKRRANLKVKLQMAEFLQDTIEEIAVSPKAKKNDSLKAFVEFVQKVRENSETPANEEIIKYSKYFQDEITLENIPHAQLKALCRLLMISPIGPSNLLRLKIDMKLQELKRDDKIIQREGIDTLDYEELQTACGARGMRSLGIPIDQLRNNLKQWIELSLIKDIPASLLLLSRTLYYKPDIKADELKVTISQFPERLIDEMEVQIGAVEREAVDRQTIIDIIQHEEDAIKQEQDIQTTEEISKKELLDVIETTITNEREELDKIKEDRKEYVEDLAEMKLVKDSSKENVASQRLGNRVEAMLNKIDSSLAILENDIEHIDKDQDGLVSTEELFHAIQALRGAPDEAKTRRLIEALDEDKDGTMSLDELRRVIELIATEDLDLDPDHITEVMHLLKGTEKIFVAEQMLSKKKTNYLISLMPYVYGRKPIPASFR